jgi:DNA-binding NarL/FixJ family response regulator
MAADPLWKRRAVFSDEEWERITEIRDLRGRKAQIALRILAGMSDEHISQTLGIEKSTLRSHLRQIYERLNVNNRLGLAVELFLTFRAFIEYRPGRQK